MLFVLASHAFLFVWFLSFLAISASCAGSGLYCEFFRRRRANVFSLSAARKQCGSFQDPQTPSQEPLSPFRGLQTQLCRSQTPQLDKISFITEGFAFWWQCKSCSDSSGRAGEHRHDLQGAACCCLALQRGTRRLPQRCITAVNTRGNTPQATAQQIPVPAHPLSVAAWTGRSLTTSFVVPVLRGLVLRDLAPEGDWNPSRRCPLTQTLFQCGPRGQRSFGPSQEKLNPCVQWEPALGKGLPCRAVPLACSSRCCGRPRGAQGSARAAPLYPEPCSSAAPASPL